MGETFCPSVGHFGTKNRIFCVFFAGMAFALSLACRWATKREMEGCSVFDSCRICGNPPPLDRDYDLCAECLDCETEIMEMSGFAIWRTESSIHAFGYRG